ncbi:uncharacterized protein LOC125877273 [Solanum stenotomum]|uniref:uncharacterized protein LOC125877273 n=1 Tax=Solanum stenotomum TaxID=172797 RepID=UPI0020D0FECE|nr:uncharacterized protein LOC125877273 [Solanum stenotomum]
MTTLRASGREYTWTNGHTYRTIDWGLVNARWMMTMALHELFIMDPECSDHSPLSLYLAQDEDTRPRPFKFLNHVAGHEKFPKIIEEMWSKRRGRCRMADIWRNLKHIKKAMKHLNATEFGAVEERINSCRHQLAMAQEDMRAPGQPMEKIEAEKQIKLQLEKWLNVEESIMRQKSKVQWLKLGDATTTFFHANLKQSYGVLQPVSEEEVVDALKRINDLKAPRCDGFNALFFKKAWPMIGEDIIEVVQEFFQTGVIYKAINCTTVTLIPKIPNPDRITQYRPIS